MAFFLLFAAVGAWKLWQKDSSYLWWSGAALFFLMAAIAFPRALAPLNQIWTRLGLFLHRIVNPLVMAIMFFGVIVPSGLVLRLLGRDPMRLRGDRTVSSYWIPREPPGPDPNSMKNQF